MSVKGLIQNNTSQGREILAKDNLLDPNAPEDSETLDERCVKLDAGLDHLTTRLARLLAEFTNTKRKLEVIK